MARRRRRGTLVEFNFNDLERAIREVLAEAIDDMLAKAEKGAKMDAPVRSIFKKSRKRGFRRRPLTLAEAGSEDAIRRIMHQQTRVKGSRKGPVMASPTTHSTVGRESGLPDNPYLRKAQQRKGNPNAWQPFLLRRGTTERVMVGPKGRQFIKKIREPDVPGGREIATTPSGGRYLRIPRARRALTVRGRYEVRTGRANYTDEETGKTTVGGTLRGAIYSTGASDHGKTIGGQVISPVYYSWYQEFGTRHRNRATPYMRPQILSLLTHYRSDLIRALNTIKYTQQYIEKG